MSRTGKLRVVLAGCGGISGVWTNSPAVSKNCEFVGLVDIRKEAAERKAEKLGIDDIVTGTDLKEVLRATEPDIVFDVAVPEAHCGITLTALAHGCHVLGEKPLAVSMTQARRMAAAAEKAGRVFAVTQNYRYRMPIRALTRFIRSGAIGRITTVYSDFFVGAHFGGFRDVMDHVLLLDMSIHTFDAARLITGEDPVDVYCRDWNPPGSWYKDGASAAAIFNMTNDIVYSYRGSWCAEGHGTGWDSHWRIIGEKGTILWDGGDGIRCQVVAGKTGFSRKTKERTVPMKCPGYLTGGHEGVFRSFIKAVKGGPLPETDCRDNIKSLGMVLGAVKSAESGRRVNLTA